MDSLSSEDFDTKTTQLEEKWNSIAPGFHPWFLKHKSDTFKTSLIAPVREAAQLGYRSPPKAYTDNANESKNFVLKDWVDFNKSTIHAFIAELRSFVHQSLIEAEHALYGAGEYYLSKEFKHLEVWVKMASSFRKIFSADISIHVLVLFRVSIIFLLLDVDFV